MSTIGSSSLDAALLKSSSESMEFTSVPVGVGICGSAEARAPLVLRVVFAFFGGKASSNISAAAGVECSAVVVAAAAAALRFRVVGGVVVVCRVAKSRADDETGYQDAGVLDYL